MNPIEVSGLYGTRACEDRQRRVEILCGLEVKQIASVQASYSGRFSVAKNATRAG
jgi:hypothetical protein